MPTHEEDARFLRDFNGLTSQQKALFVRALRRFIEDLDRDGLFRASLRVMPMQGFPGIWEMTWEGEDGRATFAYGPEKVAGKRHIVWRRVGTHGIFDNP